MSDQTKNHASKKEREQARIRARRALRVTYDLPPALRQRIKELAEEQGLPASQLVTLALLRFLKEYDQGAVNLSRYKQPSRSPRYDWNLRLPAEVTAPMRKKGSRAKPEDSGGTPG
jgi:hypothetical protein